MIRIVLSDEAQSGALEAFSFYEERVEGLGERFRDHVGAAFARSQASPELYPAVYRDLRRTLVERFPYAILSRRYPARPSSSRSCTQGKTLPHGNVAQPAMSLANKLLKRTAAPRSVREAVSRRPW